jgi:hypothetical protein
MCVGVWTCGCAGVRVCRSSVLCPPSLLGDVPPYALVSPSPHPPTLCVYATPYVAPTHRHPHQ